MPLALLGSESATGAFVDGRPSHHLFIRQGRPTPSVAFTIFSPTLLFPPPPTPFPVCSDSRMFRRLQSACVLLTLVLVTCGMAVAGADVDAAPPTEYFARTYGIDAGLPHPTVTATLQTRDGYLWVGTQGGL